MCSRDILAVDSVMNLYFLSSLPYFVPHAKGPFQNTFLSDNTVRYMGSGGQVYCVD